MPLASQPNPAARSGKGFRSVSYVVAALGLMVSLWCIWSAARIGLSRLTTSYAAATNLLPAADEAIRLSPSDPDAHYIRAALLASTGELNEGIREYERAASLRPLDYVLWLRLGSARDEVGDTEGALAAFREAVRLAPAYSKPHWQLGNLLLRANRRDEAFAEMRLAAISRPTLLPNFIDLVWSISKGDAQAVERVVRPETDFWRLALARFFVKRGKTTEALALFRATGAAAAEDRRALLSDLLAAKQFPEAYQIWSIGMNGESERRSTANLTDPGFEEQIKLDAPGFGWQIARDLQSVRVSIDRVQPRQGASSLRLDWNGDSNPASPIVSQLILVEPNARYLLRFAARSEELVTGGLPLVAVIDSSSNDARQLVQSNLFPSDTSPWHDYNLEFATGNETRAVLVFLRRQNCSGGTCPVFGRLWLDDFSLQKL